MSNSRKTSLVFWEFGGSVTSHRWLLVEEQEMLLRNKTWPSWLFLTLFKTISAMKFFLRNSKNYMHGAWLSLSTSPPTSLTDSCKIWLPYFGSNTRPQPLHAKQTLSNLCPIYLSACFLSVPHWSKSRPASSWIHSAQVRRKPQNFNMPYKQMTRSAPARHKPDCHLSISCSMIKLFNGRNI